MKQAEKVLVVGLDSAPTLLLDEWLPHLPNLRRLAEEGVYGPIESSVPAITIPAWATFATSKNPGQLGFFGFRNRLDCSYDRLATANATSLKEPTIWQLLSQAGKRVGLMGVPQTYPPPQVNGFVISCFMTPGADSEYTWPRELKEEIRFKFGDYLFDCKFRTEAKAALLAQIYQMTGQHFRIARHLLSSLPWDFFMMVEMGPDRLQHAFWKYFDPQHRKYQAGSDWERAIPSYYQYLDREIGELLAGMGDEVAVIVVSDHGAKRMEGSFNLNDWLIQEGYLQLAEPVTGVTELRRVRVDWSRTIAWGWGGYYGRVFLNVAGREAQGIVPPAQYERLRDDLAGKLAAIKDDRGRPMATRALRPQEVYHGPYTDQAPDLCVYFDDLYWRASEDVGHDGLYAFETELGPDDAVHDQHGIYILRPPGGGGGRRLEGLRLLDGGAPTILQLFGLPVPEDMEGKPVAI